MNLDIACGQNLAEGFTGIDIAPLDGLFSKEMWVPPHYEDHYVQHDLYDTPWPFETSSISQARINHFVEYIPHQHPNWGFNDEGWWVFFTELHRVMKRDAIVEVRHPFSRSDKAVGDPRAKRAIHFQTWFWLSKDWRFNYDVSIPDVDFHVANINAVDVAADIPPDMEDFALNHWFNPAQELDVTLEVRK